MCNSYAAKANYREYVEAFSHQKLPLVWPPAHQAPNLEPRDPIRPTDRAPVIRAHDGARDGDGERGVELVELRWGFAPGRPKAGPVINYRSEGRRFERGRCLVPVSHFYEYTGDRYPKTPWRFSRPGEDWFCFAGLWRVTETKDGPAEAFTLLTTGPGPDVQPYHDRQPVVLDRADWSAWLTLSRPEAELLRPSPPGTFEVAKVER